MLFRETLETHQRRISNELENIQSSHEAFMHNFGARCVARWQLDPRKNVTADAT